MTSFLIYYTILLIFLVHYCYGNRYSSRRSRYDKSINVFSPDGDLLQVSYAEIASEKGFMTVCLPVTHDNINITSNSSMTITSEDARGLVICIEKSKIENILLRAADNKFYRIHDSVWLVFSGLAGDGREIVRKARDYCAAFEAELGSPPSILSIANHIGNYQHMATIDGTRRPLGIHSLIVGFDDETPKIYSVRASGLVSAWKAYSIGRQSKKIIRWLEKNFKTPLPLRDAVDNAIVAMRGAGLEASEEKEDDEIDYDLYYLRRGLHGRPVVTRTSLASRQTLDFSGLTWTRIDLG